MLSVCVYIIFQSVFFCLSAAGFYVSSLIISVFSRLQTDCQLRRFEPLPVWSDSYSLPAADWCVLISPLAWQSDAADRLMLTRMTGRRKQHVTGVSRSGGTVTSCAGNVMLCLGGISLDLRGNSDLFTPQKNAQIILLWYVEKVVDWEWKETQDNSCNKRTRTIKFSSLFSPSSILKLDELFFFLAYSCPYFSLWQILDKALKEERNKITKTGTQEEDSQTLEQNEEHNKL